jgi:hypothetical protein
MLGRRSAVPIEASNAFLRNCHGARRASRFEQWHAVGGSLAGKLGFLY